jgi:hypothetical protein
MESLYKGYRFPPEIISYGIWLYHRFALSFRDIEELLAQRGSTVSYEAGASSLGPHTLDLFGGNGDGLGTFGMSTR